MKTTLFLLLIAVLCSSCIGRTLHERRRRVAGKEYDAYLDKESNKEDEYYHGDYEYEEYGDDYNYNVDMFSCFSGEEQVAYSVMCDGFDDCTDGSDEVVANCEEIGITTTTPSTAATTTTPTTTTTTTTTSTPVTLPPVEPSVRKLEDYGDYDDACTAEEFQCQSDLSICLPQTQVCDGIPDCPDKEDEANCTEIHFDAYPVIPQARPVFEGGFDFDTDLLDINYKPSKDAKTPPNEMDYFYYTDNRNGAAIDLPSAASTVTGRRQESEPSSTRRPLVIIKPPPSHKDVLPVFIPAEKPVDNSNDLALEADYEYIILDDEDSLREALLKNVPEPDPTYSANGDKSDDLAQEGEIEINHDTGEIILFENGEEISLSAAEQDNSEQGKSTFSTSGVVPKIIEQTESRRKTTTENPTTTLQTIQHSKTTTTTTTTTRQNEDNPKMRKKIEKQRKKFRGIVAQLLHQVGKLVETGSESEQDNIQTNININVGSGVDLSSTGSLYSRILSQSSSLSNIPRLRINVDVQL